MAEALVSILLEQLASVVFEQTKQAVTLVLNAEGDVQSFSNNLKAIRSVLEDAEKKQVTQARVGDWLQKLKDVSYEMDDVLDEWNTEILRQQVAEGGTVVDTKKKVCFPTPASCFCFGKVNKAIHYHHIARRIKELNEKLNVIAAEKEKYDFHQSTVRGTDEQLIERQKTSSLVDISTIYGREEEKEILLSKLLRDSDQDGERYLVIPIVGMGGMGKTTLAQLAYNDERVRNHFDKKVWVCVSDPFDEVKIAKAIIENLDKNETQRNSDELETLILCIKSHVENKKFLLVLDDVWTDYETKWNNLKLPIIMQSCAKGSTMLVTTRKEGVAKMIMMRATGSMIHLDKLNDQDCLALFNSIAFLNREEDEANGFGDIGVEIVKKCRGLPLITKTLGSLVRDKKRKEEWRDVLNSKTWELEEVEEQVFRPLLLSYYDLAPPIKRCLLYCAIFPKDYELRKSDLIEMWMSQDYLNTKGNKGKRALGENYFESLAMRSFFQDFSKNEVGDVDGCKMHDIVHDFVQFLTKAECFIKEGADGGNERMELLGDEVRLLTLTNLPQGPLDTSFYGCQNMRTLAILESKITAISFDTIAKMKCLRTLNLTGNKLNELPEQIGELIHLRFMDLSRNEALKELPDAVCDLCNLQTLNVRVCEQLEKLPKAMGKLINLKHLYIGGCDELKYIPKGIRNLKSLQVLDWFYGCKSDDDEALKLEDLGMMDQLQGSLSIERFGNKDDDASQIAKAQLGNKEHLSELRVFFQEGIEEQRKGDEERLKALEPHQNLESLWIWDCHVGNADSLYWVKSLHNLRRVDLCDWGFCEVLPPLGKLPSLEVLEIKWMRMVKRVGVEFLGIEEEEEVSAGILFPKLKRLSFYGMNNWEEWEGISKDSCEITIMPRLSFLQINLSSRLKALPDFLYKIEALHTLKIKYCDILEEEHEKGVGKEWHKISHIPNLTIQNSTW